MSTLINWCACASGVFACVYSVRMYCVYVTCARAVVYHEELLLFQLKGKSGTQG